MRQVTKYILDKYDIYENISQEEEKFRQREFEVVSFDVAFERI